MAYQRDFDFDQGNLGRNLALLPDRIRDFIDRDIEVHTVKGEQTMKLRAPWTQTGQANKWGRVSTGMARNGLWADNEKFEDSYRITMGHTMSYGTYLENNYELRYAIVLPTLKATARSFMRSTEEMFAQLETHVTVAPYITPGEGVRPSTSQGYPGLASPTDTRPNLAPAHRDSLGRFMDQGKGFSKAAKAAKALANKVAAVNARRRERYAERKAAGTLPTRKTKRG